MRFNNKEIGKDRFEIEDIECLDDKQLLEYQIAVMQWYRDGGEVEVQYHDDGERLSIAGLSLCWNWEMVVYFPVSKPSYEERQAKWIEENNVKVGDKVKCLPFTDFQDGFSWGIGKAGCFFDKTVRISYIGERGVKVTNDETYYFFPYFALELVKPSYEERQAKWVEENNVKVGQKVKCLPFTDFQDGCKIKVNLAEKFFNRTAEIEEIVEDGIRVSIDISTFAFPYFALGLVKPQYKPYEKADPAWLVKTDEVVKHKDRNRFTKIEGIDNDGKQKIAGITNSNWLTLQFEYITFEDGTIIGGD